MVLVVSPVFMTNITPPSSTPPSRSPAGLGMASWSLTWLKWPLLVQPPPTPSHSRCNPNPCGHCPANRIWSVTCRQSALSWGDEAKGKHHMDWKRACKSRGWGGGPGSWWVTQQGVLSYVVANLALKSYTLSWRKDTLMAAARTLIPICAFLWTFLEGEVIHLTWRLRGG